MQSQITRTDYVAMDMNHNKKKNKPEGECMADIHFANSIIATFPIAISWVESVLLNRCVQTCVLYFVMKGVCSFVCVWMCQYRNDEKTVLRSSYFIMGIPLPGKKPSYWKGPAVSGPLSLHIQLAELAFQKAFVSSYCRRWYCGASQ